MLDYFHMDPWFRQFHQNNLTFSMWYHHSENYMLALSHDEVVHGKSNIIGKMPGDEWQKFANVRCLFAYMFAHPGKKTMFMSMEFGQWSEWNVWADLEWHLLQYNNHKLLKQFFSDLNLVYKTEPALYTRDFEEAGFEWIDCSDNRHSVVAFIRRGKDPSDFLIAVCNFTPNLTVITALAYQKWDFIPSYLIAMPKPMAAAIWVIWVASGLMNGLFTICPTL